jgi:hypothetical protein
VIINDSTTRRIHEQLGMPSPLQNGHERDSLAAQLARRHEAALRLPPLDCGCRDPGTRQHASRQCRYGTAA